MQDKKMKLTIIFLIFLSAAIYGMQLLIFRDPQTTGFYILQDMAFLPFTIAIATLVVGEILGAKEKKERLEKTRMLTSSFFTELGTDLVFDLMQAADCSQEVQTAVREQISGKRNSPEELQQILKETRLRVKVSETLYNAVKDKIMGCRTTLLVISSNPLLLEHESFTDMLWSIFHLVDEFRLRGEYKDLRIEDIRHFENDFSDVFQLLLVNWTANVQYMKQTYPNFYTEAKNRRKIKEE